VILLAVLMVCFVRGAAGQNAAPQKIADGAWFLISESSEAASRFAGTW
jgi:hypothetical protein